MALVSMRELLDHAAENGYGIPAFNVNNLEQVQAVMEAAKETGAPVILQASAGARKYAGEAFIKHLIQAAVEMYPGIPLVMHQDHGQNPDVCQGAINLGFSSVMMDGSLEADGKTIASYDYNVDVTRKVVDMAHKLGVTVEGELGCLGSLETMKGDKEDGHGTDATMTREQLLTDPEQAADFVKAHAAGRAGDCHRHQPRRLQVHAQAHRRHPGDQTASRKSTAASPTRTWSCMARPAYRRTCWPSFASTADR
jgi:fructose-bisphosphate aldolase class II